MERARNLQDLFKRYRQPADLVFALGFFLFSVFLLANLPFQTAWVKGTALFAQPSFWPGVGVLTMALFSFMHLIGSLVSERIPGRMEEVVYWARSLEFVAWFMAYVTIVPVFGYLLSTIAFCNILAWRLDYRSARSVIAATLFAVAVVVFFKSFLQVKIPAGAIYEYLPSGIRTFFMIRL